MEILDFTSIIIACLGGIYVPYWIYQQQIKSKRSEDLNNELTEIKLLLKEVSVRHEVILENHEKRITKLEDVV